MADEETASAVIASLLDTYFGGADRSELLQAAGLDNVGVDGNSELQEEEQQAAQALLSALAGDSALVRAEASRVTGTEYDRKATRVIVRRGESRLVARYRQTLDDDDDDGMRLRLAVGYTDLYRVQHGDLIEAKVSAEHRYVRQALGQLLDYAAHCTHPLNRLTALFPQVPSPADIQLLHIYGIDCLYWAGSDHFRRLEAPAEARQRISASWPSPAR
jgi:hypothetical protein